MGEGSGNTVKVVYGGPTVRTLLAGAGHKTKLSSLIPKQVHPVPESVGLGWVWGRLSTSPVRDLMDTWIEHPVSLCRCVPGLTAAAATHLFIMGVGLLAHVTSKSVIPSFQGISIAHLLEAFAIRSQFALWSVPFVNPHNSLG